MEIAKAELEEFAIKVFDGGVRAGRGGYHSFDDVIHDESNYPDTYPSKKPTDVDKATYRQNKLDGLLDLIKH